MLAAALGGCATARDFHDPSGRMLDSTAYTIRPREVRVEAGAVGVDLRHFGANVDVSVGFAKRAEVSMNVAHVAMGAVNLRGKYTLVDQRHFALGVSGGIWWAEPELMWVLEKDTRDALRNIDILSVPLALHWTMPTTEWMDINVTTGYQHATIIGEADAQPVLFEGTFGLRTFSVEPALLFYVRRRVAIVVAARLPIVARQRSDFVITQDVLDGIQGGIRSGDWESVAFNTVATYYGGVETQWGRTHLQLFLSHSQFTRYVTKGNIPVLPGFNLYWRI